MEDLSLESSKIWLKVLKFDFRILGRCEFLDEYIGLPGISIAAMEMRSEKQSTFANPANLNIKCLTTEKFQGYLALKSLPRVNGATRLK